VHSGSGSPATRFALMLVRAYQSVRVGHQSACRFYPSCSQYAAEAIETHGAVWGVGLAARRLLRCRPLWPRGVDLVPAKQAAQP
jgi:uncharacterized protein